MSEKIEFTDFCIEAGTFSCKVKSSKRENADILTFETNPPVKNITTDAIALALAKMCIRDRWWAAMPERRPWQRWALTPP